MRALAPLSLLALAACSGDAPPPVNRNTMPPAPRGSAQVTGGAVVRDAGPSCTSMGVLCDGQTPYTCAPDGRPVAREACGGATPFCAPGIGCLACLPAAVRCDPERPDVVQRCTPDGSRWADAQTCDAAAGQRCTEGSCGDPCAVAEGARAYLGCDYWATQTPNGQLNPAFTFAVALANPQTYAVTVQIRGGALAETLTRELAPGSVTAVELPWVRPLVQFGTLARSAVVRGGAYHVHATAPVAAYQFNPLRFDLRNGMADRGRYSFTNDASLLISQRALTQRYLAVMAPHWNARKASGTVVLGGFLAITAVAGETTSVTVRLPTNHGVSDAEGQELRHDNLMPGDVALVVGDSAGDLSGALVESSAPVAVFVGNDCTNVPPSRTACDHLEEQLFPLETLGRDYVVARLRDRELPYLARVVAAFDDTLVRFEPASFYPPVRLRAREVLELAAEESFRLTSSRPVAVTQFMIGQGTTAESVGDPAMVLEVPTQQFRARHDLLVPDTYERNFLSVVAPAGAQVLLDGVPFEASRERLGAWDVWYTPYTPGGRSPVAPGQHRLTTSSGVPLGVKVYGTARYTSYMYPGGLDLRLLPPG